MKNLLFITILLLFLWVIITAIKSCDTKTPSTSDMKTYSETLKNDKIVGETADCQEFIEIHSAKYLAKEYGNTENWVLNNVKIYLWQKESSMGKGKRVGSLLPGSRAIIVTEGANDFKVKSPLDNSIGWISKIQVSRTLMQNKNTYEPCE